MNSAIARHPTGNFVVVWQSEQDGSSFGIFGQRFSADGSPPGDEARVNTHSTGWQDRPAVGLDGAGDFVVVWESLRRDGDLYGVFGQRFAVNLFTDGFESGDTSAWSGTVP